MKKHLFTFILIILFGGCLYAGYRFANHSLIQMSLLADLKSPELVQHSLLDKQAKKEMLLLYQNTNQQLETLAKTSKNYFSYENQKAPILSEQEKSLEKILASYRQRRNRYSSSQD